MLGFRCHRTQLPKRQADASADCRSPVLLGCQFAAAASSAAAAQPRYWPPPCSSQVLRSHHL